MYHIYLNEITAVYVASYTVAEEQGHSEEEHFEEEHFVEEHYEKDYEVEEHEEHFEMSILKRRAEEWSTTHRQYHSRYQISYTLMTTANISLAHFTVETLN